MDSVGTLPTELQRISQQVHCSKSNGYDQKEKTMTDRFDLEQQILKCWNITEELQLLNEQVLENDSFTKDQISNYLLGLHTIYEVKFEKMFDQFSELVQTGKIR